MVLHFTHEGGLAGGSGAEAPLEKAHPEMVAPFSARLMSMKSLKLGISAQNHSKGQATWSQSLWIATISRVGMSPTFIIAWLAAAAHAFPRWGLAMKRDFRQTAIHKWREHCTLTFEGEGLRIRFA